MEMIRLLIIERHLAVRLALEVRLHSSPSIEVIATAENVGDAQLCLETYQPDIVLFGLAVGQEENLGQTIKMISHLRALGIPGIVLTAYADDMERELMLGAGATRYLLKNINSTELIKEIESVVRTAAVS